MNLSKFTITDFIDLLKKNKRRYIKAAAITFVVAAIYALSLPKEYTASTTMAPEFTTGSSMSGLTGLASMAGIDLSKMTAEEDALFPDLYPDIIKSTEFVDKLLKMRVTTADGELTTDLKTYLADHQSMAWWDYGILFLKRLLPKKDKNQKPVADGASGGENGPLVYSEKELMMLLGLSKSISLKQELKTGIITVTTTAQDPLIAAVLADSVSSQLQNYIFNYRTHKASVDLAYANRLSEKAKQEYDEATRAYASYADRHHNTILESSTTRRDYLENEMQLKFQLYTQYCQQAAVAQARLQARTPVYNIIQPAVVPIRKSAPKRMTIVLLWEIIVFCGLSVWLMFRKEKA